MDDDSIIRPLHPDDAPRLAELLTRSRAFMAPFEPEREEDWFTVAGQALAVERSLAQQEAGQVVASAILSETGEVAGRINLNNIVRGAFQSCSMGYWLDEGHTGRGLASRAVAAMVRIAFVDLGLHRVEAGTLVHNTASQKVLLSNDFQQFALAPSYLRIAGRWQDHLLFQRISPID
ncbi:MAG: GNAT family N-acetyltransferase [Kineosporiaceae bacterium]|nr:GNAT family N-acetyltransferase [Kineosporiaceae bacterium]MBK7623623.1 GNAT family N-acetyltransferase [Kineosporiaceae bacterium]MBK8077968.1 GNAT family N-acetyltransferase [Kineosporiaceae bacterium]